MRKRRAACAVLVLSLAASASALSGCSEEDLQAFADAATGIYEAVGHRSVAMGEDHRAWACRYDFHHGAWDGAASIEINGGTPFFTRAELDTGPEDWAEPEWETGPGGKAKSVAAFVAPDAAPGQAPGDARIDDPAGWQRAEYPGAVDGGLLYRRVSLLPEALGGDGSGCIAGTAWLATALDGIVSDAGARVPAEGMLWRAEAFYEGFDNIPEGVLIEAWALDGSWSCCYYIHNVQPGIGIDYADGFSWLEKAGDPRPKEEDGQEAEGHGGDAGEEGQEDGK